MKKVAFECGVVPQGTIVLQGRQEMKKKANTAVDRGPLPATRAELARETALLASMLACPFCGGSADVMAAMNPTPAVCRCRACGASASASKTVEGAVREWNRRASVRPEAMEAAGAGAGRGTGSPQGAPSRSIRTRTTVPGTASRLPPSGLPSCGAVPRKVMSMQGAREYLERSEADVSACTARVRPMREWTEAHGVPWQTCLGCPVFARLSFEDEPGCAFAMRATCPGRRMSQPPQAGS